MRCKNTKWVFPPSKPHGQLVPCGKCISCLSNKRADWSFRLEQEHKVSVGSAFITLTYHPKYVPDQGVSKDHLQKFMKRLRKIAPRKLRYYAVGEYGTKTKRPHYHIILFNYEGSENLIQRAWTFGIIHIGKVTSASIRYVTKYVIQKDDQVERGLSKPFTLMSRSYGLGGSYLTDEMVQWHRVGERNYTYVNGVQGRLPRYYKEKIWPEVKGWKGQFYAQDYGKKVRDRISETSKQDSQKAEEKNINFLKKRGYNPESILAEMREAVEQRVKQKIAFTQTI